MNSNIFTRCIYIGCYCFLNLILTGLLLITPGDAIRQALDNNQLYNVFVISGGYFLTLLLAITLYASRYFAENAILKAIPKTWVPIEKGDVSMKVRKMILLNLDRSALIAWCSRPRLAPIPAKTQPVPSIRDHISILHQKSGKDTVKEDVPHRFSSCSKKSFQIPINSASCAVWGKITHDGWSSPMSPNFPHLEYITVIRELPYLIEAKVVSLASSGTKLDSKAPLSHVQALNILQRPAAMGLREYLAYLGNLDVITVHTEVDDFLLLYEYARFSERPLQEQEFNKLMKLFSDILQVIRVPSSDLFIYEKDFFEDYNVDFKQVTTYRRSQSQTSMSSYNNSNQGGSDTTIQRIS